MQTNRRKVIELGRNTFVISLTQELKKMGMEKGDEVKVFYIGDKIVISKNDIPIPFLTRENWTKFLFALEKDEKKDEMDEVLSEFINKGIVDYIKLVSRTLFKIKIS